MIEKFPNVYYRTVIPGKTGEFEQEWKACLHDLLTNKEQSEDILFKLVIFCLPDNQQDYIEKRELIASSLKKEIPQEYQPAYVLVAQKPETPFKVSIEAAFVKQGDYHFRSREFRGIPYVIFEKKDYKELWVCGIEGSASRQSYEQGSSDAFMQVLELLSSEKMEYNHIVRQWNYIGHILQESCIESTLLQNYQIYNEVRHQYYHKHLTIDGFPAATGIGNEYEGVFIDMCAIRSDNKVAVCSVTNPNQVNPFVYGQDVLEGSPIHEQTRKNPPEFERAKLVVSDGISRLFISGTASIVGQKTIGIGDVEEQTRCTIRNMEILYSVENLVRCSNLPVSRELAVKYLRVYIKNETDLEKVKRICALKYPNIPIVYSFTDVCRNDLLVEIEGELQY